VVFDRSKDVMVLSDKSLFSPQFLEARAQIQPISGRRTGDRPRPNYVVAIVCIDYNTTGKWAEDHNTNYTSYQELSQLDQVYDLVTEQIAGVNRRSKKPKRSEDSPTYTSSSTRTTKN